MGIRSTVISSLRGSARVPSSVMVFPFTCTRPSRMICSQARRLSMPAAARIFWRRSWPAWAGRGEPPGRGATALRGASLAAGRLLSMAGRRAGAPEVGRAAVPEDGREGEEDRGAVAGRAGPAAGRAEAEARGAPVAGRPAVVAGRPAVGLRVVGAVRGPFGAGFLMAAPSASPDAENPVYQASSPNQGWAR